MTAYYKCYQCGYLQGPFESFQGHTASPGAPAMWKCNKCSNWALYKTVDDMTRRDVYNLINGEREYQNTRWPGHKHSATEYLVYIDHYVRKALDRVSTEDGETGALENLRKIAALAVAAMEQHGAPARI